MLDVIGRFGAAWYWPLAWLLLVLLLAWHRGLCRELRAPGSIGNRVNRVQAGFLILTGGLLINTVAYGIDHAHALPEMLSIARALAGPAMVVGALLLLSAVGASLRDRLLIAGSSAAVMALALLAGLA